MAEPITLVVVGADWAGNGSLLEFSLRHVDATEVVLIANKPIVSLAAIGNHYLEHARTPVVGLVHADCIFGPGSIKIFTETALSGKVCGIVGVDKDYVYRWANHNPGEVVTMDSCSVFLRRDLGLRFDPRTFHGLHCHVEDICMLAKTKGIPVVVPQADADHSGISNNAAPWRAQYQPFRDALCAKWGGPVITT